MPGQPSDDLREVPQPPHADAVVPFQVLTVVWAVAFVVLLALHSRLADSGRLWWIGAAFVGTGTGVVGLWWVLRRRRRGEGETAPPPDSPTAP